MRDKHKEDHAMHGNGKSREHTEKLCRHCRRKVVDLEGHIRDHHRDELRRARDARDELHHRKQEARPDQLRRTLVLEGVGGTPWRAVKEVLGQYAKIEWVEIHGDSSGRSGSGSRWRSRGDTGIAVFVSQEAREVAFQ